MTGQKILIVDDSKTIRMQVRDLLPKGNFEILEARDGVEGLDVISREMPSLVLLDFFMPRMNGWEVVQHIQADPKLKAIPVVMMSGRREDVEKTAPELFNYFEFVGKPFEPAHLFRAIKAATVKAKERQDMKTLAPLAPQKVEAVVIEAIASPSTEPTPAGKDELRSLKAEVQQLRIQNVKLQQEMESLRKQMMQVVSYIRQKVK
ncbi:MULTISPECIES: response regulator [unclassified Leptolyngbya]|uniref:response regulator n=1 Tax=unclassified Leptolyngbya TaxID=2650499 RepID=UPI001686A9E6|nr:MULTISPECIES: response regulator [unclassified Leptolyngbya]MBD1910053.1 response regulator [Leptolyngbya sp. FACHB-8]MBD2153071.1 response regulator [Leptolyngbya sp. FACHB-16]